MYLITGKAGSRALKAGHLGINILVALADKGYGWEKTKRSVLSQQHLTTMVPSRAGQQGWVPDHRKRVFVCWLVCLLIGVLKRIQCGGFQYSWRKVLHITIWRGGGGKYVVGQERFRGDSFKNNTLKSKLINISGIFTRKYQLCTQESENVPRL